MENIKNSTLSLALVLGMGYSPSGQSAAPIGEKTIILVGHPTMYQPAGVGDGAFDRRVLVESGSETLVCPKGHTEIPRSECQGLELFTLRNGTYVMDRVEGTTKLTSTDYLPADTSVELVKLTCSEADGTGYLATVSNILVKSP